MPVLDAEAVVLDPLSRSPSRSLSETKETKSQSPLKAEPRSAADQRARAEGVVLDQLDRRLSHYTLTRFCPRLHAALLRYDKLLLVLLVATWVLARPRLFRSLAGVTVWVALTLALFYFLWYRILLCSFVDHATRYLALETAQSRASQRSQRSQGARQGPGQSQAFPGDADAELLRGLPV